jgi:hypothetical protein
VADDGANSAAPFIEHIRAIHFGLIVATTALLIALSVSFEPRLTQKALHDCERIQHLTGEWEWGNWWAAFAADQWTTKSVLPFSGSIRYALVDLPDYKRYWKIQLPSQVWVVKTAAGASAPSIVWNGVSYEIEKRPRTLNEFRQFWNRGIQPHIVVKPRRVEFVTISVDVVDDKEDSVKTKLQLLDQLHIEPTATDVVPVGDFQVTVAPSAPLPTYSLNLVDHSAEGVPRSEYFFASPRGMPADYPHETRNMQIVAAAVTDAYPSRTPVVWLCDRLYRDWTPQQFDHAFADLLRIAPVDIGNLPLPELEDHVRASIRLTKGDVEIAGLHLPSEVLTWFAPIIIICFQLYLLLHLRVLRAAAPNIVVTPLVPWVGLFASSVARALFVISAVVLPALVLTFAVVRTVLLQLNLSDIVFQITGAAVAYAQGFSLLATIRVLWRSQSSPAISVTRAS